MKKFLFTITAILFVYTLSAQHDSKAKEILDEVSSKTQSYSTISAEFTYSMINEEEGINDGFSGSIKLKGTKYNVYIADIPTLMISDGTTIWSYMEDVNEVSISSVDDQMSEILDPSTIFTIYERGFDYSYKGEAAENGKQVYQIKLIPETEDFDFSELIVSIDKATMMISTAVMVDDMGTKYQIKVNKLEPNKPLDDSVFTFDVSKYDDIEVIDFR